MRKSALMLVVAALTISTSAMSEQASKEEAEQVGQPATQFTAPQEPAPTPAQLIVEDFQILDHATVGLAKSKSDR